MLNRFKDQPKGMEKLLRILEGSDAKKQNFLLNAIRGEDPVYAEEVESRLICFEDIATFDDMILCELLHHGNGKTWALALLEAPKELADKVMKCAPVELRGQIKEENEFMGKVTKVMVMDSRRKILGEIRDLEEKEIITLPRKEIEKPEVTDQPDIDKSKSQEDQEKQLFDHWDDILKGK